jgi:lipopolysaccharide transport system ATP-binding protein
MGTITVSNLGKAYKQYPNRWSRLAEWFIPFSKVRHRLKWVLQDINFTVKPGEAVGIIGINGAGKSTLLKMITGTTQPTTGSVHITGRVAAMLELGMGFHPDFTGRQNAIMAGQLLGYSIEKITQLMPEIEAFSEIGDYIDQPVRVYSSGMQMRLAFSVATAHRPDVLIVDEALSVGDAAFQHKSFERIREFRKAGTTLLIVSHDKHAIQNICNRAILINAGALAMQGKPEEVFDCYNAMLADHQGQAVIQSARPDGGLKTVSGTGEATIDEVAVLDSENNQLSVVAVGQAIKLNIAVSVHQDIERLVLGCAVKDRLGNIIFGNNTNNTGQVLTGLKMGDRYVYTIACLANLGVGKYSIQSSLVHNNSHIEKNYYMVSGAVLFEVINKDKVDFAGCSWNEMDFRINKENELS